MNNQRGIDSYTNHVNNITSIIQSFATILRNSESHSYNLISNQMRNDNRNFNFNNTESLFTSQSPSISPFSFTSNNNNNNNNDFTIIGTNPFNRPQTSRFRRPYGERRTNIENSFINDLINNLSPVSVIPTQLQINSATRVLPFREIVNPVNSICPVTQEHFQPNDLVMHIIHCRHNFNVDTLRRWFTVGHRCPLCRYDIREYTNNNNIIDIDTSGNSTNNQLEQEPEPEIEIETDPSFNTTNLSNVRENIPTIRISTVFDPNNNENNADSIISEISSRIRDNIISSYNDDNITGSFYIEYSVTTEDS